MTFIEYIMAAPQSTPDSLFDTLKRHFTEGEIVEIIWSTLYYNIPHRFGAALDTGTPDGDNLVVKTVAETSAERVHAR